MRAWIGRAAIGMGILGCLFALAWYWDARLDEDLAAARERERVALGLLPTSPDVDAAKTESARASSILIGRPAGTGSQRTTPPPSATPAPSAEPSATTAIAPAPIAPAPIATASNANAPVASGERLRVESGQTLYSIVRKHYGRADPALVQRVAEHNGLARPEALRAGQTLVLPAP